MLKQRHTAFAAVLLTFMLPLSAMAIEEGVHISDSRMPYILGGIAVIVLGLLIGIGMFLTERDTREIYLIMGIVPAFLLPPVMGAAIGVKLITTEPAETFVQNGIVYRLYEDHAEANGFSEGFTYHNETVPEPLQGAGIEAKDILVLPETVEERPLENIGGFSGSALRAIWLPATVRTVEENAFSGCTALEQAILSGPGEEGRKKDENRSLTVSKSAFEGCAALNRVALYDDTDKTLPCVLGESAFSGCAALKTLERFEISQMDAAVFRNSGITGLIFRERITKIGKNCFEGCRSLRSFTLPEEIESVPAGLFKDCTGLLTVELGRARQIGERAFSGCSSLCIVTRSGWPAKACEIGGTAFENCGRLSILRLGGVSSCAADAFTGSPGAALYLAAPDADTQKSADKASVPLITEENAWDFELLDDGTLCLNALLFGRRTETMTVPAIYGGLPVSSLSLDLSLQRDEAWKELAFEEGIRFISLIDGMDSLTCIRLPDSLEKLDLKQMDRQKEIIVRTDSQDVIEYLYDNYLLQPRGAWTVEPES